MWLLWCLALATAASYLLASSEATQGTVVAANEEKQKLFEYIHRHLQLVVLSVFFFSLFLLIFDLKLIKSATFIPLNFLSCPLIDLL